MVDSLDPDQLRALSAAVTEGTFDAAARTLHVTPSAVSQRIKALETQTGRVLLRRSKPVTTTPSGEILLRAARQLETISADVADQLGQDGVNRSLTLAGNADSLATWLLPALAPIATGPQPIVVDIRRDDETRTAALLRDGTATAAVTALREPVSGCSVRRLGAMRYRACAAPAFAHAQLPRGGTVDELAAAPIVSFDHSDLLQDRYLRRRSRRHLTPPRHYVPGSRAFVDAIVLGLGWGMVPDLQSRARIAAGELISFDDTRPIDVALYWQQWRLRSTALERVADAVKAGAATALV